MPIAAWRQRFFWSLPPNPWERAIQRAWKWSFLDEHGSGWGRWFVEPVDGGEQRLAHPDVPPAYSTGIALGNRMAIVGSATKHGFFMYRVEPEGAHYLARLQALGKPYAYYLFAGGHGTTNPEEQIRQIEAQIRFAASHLGTSSML